jgi:RNA polymerase sigma-70 factor (ECF subfamily)
MKDDSPSSRLEGLPERLIALDPKAFEEFARDFGGVFRHYFLDSGLQPFEAEDQAVSLISDITLKVVNGHYHQRDDGSFRAWVFAVLRTAVKDCWRKRGRQLPSALLREDTPQQAASRAEPDLDLILAVREAIAGLPESARQVVQLRDLEGERNYEEIAGELGITVGAARVRHSRAIAQLAESLTSDDRLKRVLDRARLRS